MMQLNVWGGSGEHGRSCYLIRSGDTRILLDCGVKRVGCGEYPLLEAAEAARIDAVFLSHAHEDHSIALPWLYKLGYKGKVWTTRATAEQLPAYFANWSRFVEQQRGELPYREADIADIRYAFLEDGAPALRWFDVSPSLRVCWGRSGHMLGSVWLLLELEGRRFFYSGDYTEESLLLGADSPREAPGGLNGICGAIVDAAYGIDAERQADKLERLYAASERILTQGGHLLLPVPASGRGQELLLLMRQRFPAVPLWLEAELLQGMEQLLRQREWLKPGAGERISAILEEKLNVIRSAEQRMALLLPDAQPGIFLSEDGMMQSAKSRWYYERLRGNSRNGIIVSGHTSKGTLASQLLAMDERERGCRMEAIRYKIHQGLPDVRRMIDDMPAGAAKLLVHAPKADTDALAERLQAGGYRNVHALQPGDEIAF